MKRKFENVELDQIATFEENGMIESGVVCYVDNKIFTLRMMRSWDNNGVIEYYTKYCTFFKTGTKTNRFHTNGNAIEVIGRV